MHVKTLGIRNCNFEAVPALQGARSPLRAYRLDPDLSGQDPLNMPTGNALGVRLTHLFRCIHSYNSAMGPRLDTGGWLTLTGNHC